MKDKRIITIGVICIFLLFSFWGYKRALEKNIQSKKVDKDKPQGIEAVEDNVIVVDSFGQYSLEIMELEGRFSVQALSYNVIEIVEGKSWREGAPIDLDDLAYVEVTYWGFDDKPHLGELIVNKDIAEEVATIFQEIYKAKFPIEKIRLIDEYNANDDLSMEDNNTSAFCYRVVTGGKALSKHSYGVAIDINPVQNPYVTGSEVLPKKGREFLNRNYIRKGMIVKDDVVYRAFKSRGWKWGGEWNSLKDYQHFQKDITIKNN